MIPTSGFRVITNRTTGKELARVKTNWEVVLGSVNNCRLITDHGPIELKFKRGGRIWATLEATNGRVLCEQDLGTVFSGESMVFQAAP